ncbi:MAG: PIN domain-containing protein [Actinomycetaceae bacterium]|nr:PIN domain-containing protein [Actinomycetaceae bacterium]
MAGFRVALDANVLFPIVQADLLLHLADENAYVPLWSAEILGELTRALISTGATSEQNALRRVAMMNEAFPDAQIHNWEGLVGGIKGIPDPDDRHVIAAAIEGNASAIVTNNLKDFPDEALALHGLHAKSCDDFLLDLFDLYPERFTKALESMQAMRRNPAVTIGQLVSSLEVSCPNFVSAYRESSD